METSDDQWVECSESGRRDCFFPGMFSTPVKSAKFCVFKNKYCLTSCEYCRNTCPCPYVVGRRDV